MLLQTSQVADSDDVAQCTQKCFMLQWFRARKTQTYHDAFVGTLDSAIFSVPRRHITATASNRVEQGWWSAKKATDSSHRRPGSRSTRYNHQRTQLKLVTNNNSRSLLLYAITALGVCSIEERGFAVGLQEAALPYWHPGCVNDGRGV